MSDLKKIKKEISEVIGFTNNLYKVEYENMLKTFTSLEKLDKLKKKSLKPIKERNSKWLSNSKEFKDKIEKEYITKNAKLERKIEYKSDVISKRIENQSLEELDKISEMKKTYSNMINTRLNFIKTFNENLEFDRVKLQQNLSSRGNK